MRLRAICNSLLPVLAAGLLSQPALAYDYTAPVPLHALASFDPANGVVPFPTNLLFQGTTDLTLNIPIADPTSPTAAPTRALNALDGFSTVAPWSTGFSTALTAGSVIAGQTVRMFQVTLSGPGGAVTGVVRELASPQEFIATVAANPASGATLAIVPTKPLQQVTSYMAVVTDGVTDASGMPIRPALTYLLSKNTHALCANGASTVPALPASQACGLEPLRQLTNAQENAAAAAGVNRGDIVLSWVATTQSTTVTMQALAARTDASPATAMLVAPTGLNLSQASAALPPVADIYVGAIDLPYYLGVPLTCLGLTCQMSTSDITSTCSHLGVGLSLACPPLTDSWHAAAGAYVAPFTTAGLDPTSTNLTYANPLPQKTADQFAPVLMTLPNANSGRVKPAAGWPVVIFQHGITRDRTDMLAVAGSLSAAGFAVVAIDLPLHGVTDRTNPFFHNQLFAGTPGAGLVTSERTFDIDLENNTTGAAGSDQSIDPSGTYFINLTSLLTSRDNLRQGVADLLQLRRDLPNVLGSDGQPLFDTTRVGFLGQSLGSIEGTSFIALAQTPNLAVQNAVLNVPGGGITNLLLGSPTFGPLILSGLANAGVQPGTAAFNSFIVATQTVIDSGDPINYAFATADKNLLVQEVIGGKTLSLPQTAALCTTCFGQGKWLPDQVIPNSVPGAPLSGTEPLIAALGLPPITATTQSAGGVRGAVRFIAGTHGSLLGDADDVDVGALVTEEMQTEAASFLASDGHAVQAAVTQPVVIQTP